MSLFARFATFLFLAPVLWAAGCGSGPAEPDPCIDADGDGYGVMCTAGTDCDDDDSTLFAERTLYLDGDGDGVAGVSQAAVLCTGAAVPTGYTDAVPTEVDCDDTSAAVSVSLAGYVDGDGDGVAASQTPQTLCTAGALPVGYTDSAPSAVDCDDTSAAVSVSLAGYVDGDGDGVAASQTPQTLCTAGALPVGYTDSAPSAVDCDDTSAAVSVSLAGYVDGDGDGVAASQTPQTLCTAGALPVGYTDSAPSAVDCDDTSAAVSVSLAGYVDGDGDGVAASQTPQTLCTAGALPGGYVAAPPSAPDCDDSDVDNQTSCASCMDVDGDGFFIGCDAYATRLGPDCSDADVDNQTGCITCVDSDGDNYFVGCDAYTTRNGGDCDDDSASTYPGAAVAESSTLCMRDADLDGYGDSSAPSGGAAGSDCDDEDPNNYASCATCVDGDADGAFVGCDVYATVQQDCDDSDEDNYTSCATCADSDRDLFFAGCDQYVSRLGPDCDDADYRRNPGEPELADSGLDEDCSGTPLGALAGAGTTGTYVAAGSVDCNDMGSGTRAQPFCTLAAALSGTVGGDYFVARGVYEIVQMFPSSSTDIAIYGGYDERDWSRDLSANTTVLDANSITQYGLVLDGRRTILDGVSVVGTAAGSSGSPLRLDGDEVFLTRSEVTWDDFGNVVAFNSGGVALIRECDIRMSAAAYGVVPVFDTRLRVERSRIAQEVVGSGGTLIAAQSHSTVVTNSELVLSASTYGSPLISNGGGDVALLNNSVLIDYSGTTGTNRALIRSTGSLSGRNVTMINNAIYLAGAYVRVYHERSLGSAPADFVAYNNLYGMAPGAFMEVAFRQTNLGNATYTTPADLNACTVYCDVGGNLAGDPLFTSVPGRDLSPASGSPVVDAGTDPKPLGFDWIRYDVAINGLLRPEAVYDIGAHEQND